MLIEDQPVAERHRAQAPRRGITRELDEVSAARQVAAWLALAITVAIAVALLLGV